MYALVLAPTRELAFQISEQFEALGSKIDLKTVTIVGGVDMTAQAVSIARRPHVIVATPGRLVDHLEHTKGFSLQTFKFLVLDEADRMLGLDFEKEIDVILQSMPRERRTYLFSATMTSKVKKLQRAALANPVKVQVNSKYTTVKTLIQNYIFIPEKYKDCYLAYILNEFSGQTGLVFVRTCAECQRVALLLRNLGFKAVCLHGKMTQPKRLAALQKFKSGSRNVLIATDVASRGLDILFVVVEEHLVVADDVRTVEFVGVVEINDEVLFRGTLREPSVDDVRRVQIVVTEASSPKLSRELAQNFAGVFQTPVFQRDGVVYFLHHRDPVPIKHPGGVDGRRVARRCHGILNEDHVRRPCRWVGAIVRLQVLPALPHRVEIPTVVFHEIALGADFQEPIRPVLVRVQDPLFFPAKHTCGKIQERPVLVPQVTEVMGVLFKKPIQTHVQDIFELVDDRP